MNQTYLDIARQGKNSWWRYLLGIFFMLFFGLVGTIVGQLLVSIAFLNIIYYILITNFLENFQFTQDPIPSYLFDYTYTHFPYIFCILVIFITLRWLHQRPFMTLIGADNKFRWQRLFQAFAIWFVIQSILIFISYLIEPGNFEFTFKPVEWFLLLACALILTPIQTSTEELFFRGYILQGLGLITKQPLILMIINGILFMLPHLANPEVQRGFLWMALYYFAVGVFCTLLTLKDNRLELALGVHAANNLFHLFVTTKDSVMQLPAIWIIKDTGEPKWLLFWYLFECALFYFFVFNFRRKITSNQ